MKTVKLYEKDAYISRFEAKVLSCTATERGYKIMLDKTAFFPEGGGQPADKGRICGSGVFDVQIESGEIFHYTDSPFEAGEDVACEIDFARRFCFMQNHTAEHIVSGLVHKEYGFDNIGFHLNEEEVTFDFNGFFTENQLNELELEANRRVWQNLVVTAYYPSSDELKNTPYRAKSGIGGEIRLVKIENTDICACCAPHVNRTGEIGVIKFLATEKQHGGTRIFMKCGGFALYDYRKKTDGIKSVCELLSAKPYEVFEAVFAQNARYESGKQALKALKSQLLDYKIEQFDKSKKALAVDGGDMKDLQTAADGLHKTHGGVRTALSFKEDGAAFVMCGEESALAREFEALKAKFTVKGGGRNGIRQGSITASKEEISDYFCIGE